MSGIGERAAIRQQIIEALHDARRNGLGAMTEAEAVAHMADAVLYRISGQADLDVVAYRCDDGRQLRCVAHAPAENLIGAGWAAVAGLEVDGDAGRCSEAGCGVNVVDRVTLGDETEWGVRLPDWGEVLARPDREAAVRTLRGVNLRGSGAKLVSRQVVRTEWAETGGEAGR